MFSRLDSTKENNSVRLALSLGNVPKGFRPGHRPKYALGYQDDIIKIGRTREESMANMNELLHRLKAVNLRINTYKCLFFREELL